MTDQVVQEQQVNWAEIRVSVIAAALRAATTLTALLPGTKEVEALQIELRRTTASLANIVFTDRTLANLNDEQLERLWERGLPVHDHDVTAYGFAAFKKAHNEWTAKQFPTQTPASIHAHIRSEAQEILDASDIEQVAKEGLDIFGLLIALEHKEESVQILRMLWEKLAVNKARNWIENADGYYDHDRSQE